MPNNNPPLNCPTCSAPIKYISAGISQKTGKRYSEFWSCSNRCGFTWRKPKTGTPQPLIQEKDQGEQILKGLREIYIKLNRIEEMLSEMNKIVQRFSNENKIVVYPGEGTGLDFPPEKANKE